MRRRLLYLLIVLMLGFGVFDFVNFCVFTSKLEADPSIKAEAAIALTGGSGARIAAGVGLVESGAIQQLLVSGVHRDVSMEDVAGLGGGTAGTYDCCVTLGREATTTIGNAKEAAEWVGENGYGAIAIVTSDYHVPRSLILMAKAMPEADLIVYPVRSGIDPAAPFTDFRTFRSLFQEWLKWRITKLRSGRDGVVSL